MTKEKGNRNISGLGPNEVTGEIEPAEISDDVFEQAADWAARIESGNFSEDEQETFNFWIEADSRHRAAYQRMQDILMLTENLRVPAPDVTVAPSDSSRVRPVWWAAAATVAFIALAAWMFLPVTTQLLETQAGRLQSFVLGDGSKILLRGNSMLDVDYRLGERQIRLHRGEAVFSVANRPFRPFVVYSDGVRISAIGTVFDVAVFDGTTTVTMMEGRVDISNVDFSSSSRSADNPVVRLEAGQQVLFSEGGARSSILRPDLRQATAWHDGRIILERRPLTELVKELNRTFAGEVHVSDPDLAAMTVNVSLIADGRDETFRLLEHQLPIEFIEIGNGRYAVMARRASH